MSMRYNKRMWQKVKNIYHLFVAFLANLWYGFPSKKLTVIGVTGTDGKTTTTNMIYEVLKSAGKKVSLVSTVQAIVGVESHGLGFHVTTPSSFALQRFMKRALLAGDEYFVLEVSSHGLDQNRVAFIDFAIGVLTSLSHDHLDYHKTFENYAKAKFKLLNMAVIDAILPYGLPENITNLLNVSARKKIIRFGLNSGDQTQKSWQFKLAIPGNYNILNALAAASVGVVLHIPKATIKTTLQGFRGVFGRFEEIETGKNFRVVIDFASTPNSLEQVLRTAREQVGNPISPAFRGAKEGRVIAVYGSASERDLLKRPMMGAVSGKFANITVLTDEDPRWENPMKIIDEIAKGCIEAGAVEEVENKTPRAKGNTFYKIPNRQEAINFVIQKLAREGDIILLCGKGHEKSISYRGTETPWSEHEAVVRALQLKAQS